MKTYVVGTHWKRLGKALPMSTHNICFNREINKILYGYPLLSVAMGTARFAKGYLTQYLGFYNKYFAK